MANISLWDPLSFGSTPARLAGDLLGSLPSLLQPVTRAMDSGFRMDVAENENAYRLAIDLPGVRKEDIQVSVHENQLTITAELRDEKAANGDAGSEQANWLVRERAFGKVSRTIALPEKVDDTSAEARYTDGVLYLTLPKSRVTAAKRLTVH
jgi:HSP20 family protein